MKAMWQSWLLVDKIFVLLLGLINAVFLLRAEAVGVEPILVHVGMLAGFLLYRIFIVPKFITRTQGVAVHQMIALNWLICLYSTLNASTFAAMPWDAEALLAGWDRALFGGVSPSLWLEAYTTPQLTQWLTVAYAFFIPYLYLSIPLGVLCRPETERRDFVDGLALLYGLSFLGYLFLPAGGPSRFYAGQFMADLSGGALYQMVVHTSYQGGLHGAFPSLHVGASLFICLFDLKRNRLRGLMYAPLVLGIAAATLVLRWHYVVDVLAGVALVIALTYLINKRQPRAVQPTVPAALPYRVMRAFWRLVTCGLFFKRVETEGADAIPATGPVLICANHRNALVDALALMTTISRPITLTAKATLTRNPLLALLLRWHGIITFQRREDAEPDADPRVNAEALQACLDKLLAGEVVCLFPEGVSHSDAGMRAFRHGAARLALAYEAARSERQLPPLTLLPVGLNYDDKSRFRSHVLVVFGAPVPQAAFEKAAPALTEVLYQAVDAVTLNVRSRCEAQALPLLARLAVEAAQEPVMLGYPPRPLVRYYEAARRVARAPLAPAVVRQTIRLRATLRHAGIWPENLFLPLHKGKAVLFGLREGELLLLAAPAALWGLVTHAIPLALLRLATTKLSQDEDHWASNFLIPSIVVLPLYYGVVCAGALLAWGPVGAVGLMVSMIYGARVALLYGDRLQAALARFSAYVLFRKTPELQQRLMADARSILDGCRSLSNEEL